MTKPARYVVYHIKSTMERDRYYMKPAAEKLASRLGDQYAVATTDDYNTKIVHMVTRINLMSGLPYEEPSNTPNYMSPASEAYWSM